MDSQGRQLHQQAWQARENSDLGKSLQLSDEAMLSYQKSGDKSGLSELLADRSITFRQLAESTGDKDYLLISKAELKAAVQIAENSGNKEALALPLFNLAQVEEDLGELSESISHYKEALSHTYVDPNIFEPSPDSPAHNRPAFIANIKAHMARAEYRNGDKTALTRMEEATNEILQAPEVDPHAKNAWLSGAYMRIADVLSTDDPSKAKEALQKAKEIIDNDETLKVRRKQWEKLSNQFN